MRTEDVLAQIDDALDDWDVGPDAVRFNAPAGYQPPPTTRVHVPRAVLVRFVVNTSAFEQAMRQMAAALTHAGAEFKRLVLNRWTGPSPYDEHHPRPLAIDGHAYRRRARRRRTR